MTAYIIRRLLLIVPTLFAIMVLNFVIIQVAPGGPVEQMIAQLTGQGGEITEREGLRVGLPPGIGLGHEHEETSGDGHFLVELGKQRGGDGQVQTPVTGLGSNLTRGTTGPVRPMAPA